jgi:uridine kinase
MDRAWRCRCTRDIERRDIIVRPYQHPTGTHGKPAVVPARPLIILEGGHALATAILNVIRPIGIFIGGTARAMYALRRERDVRERGASPATFATWWPKMQEDFERFVRPNRNEAALVIQRRIARASIVVHDHLTAETSNDPFLKPGRSRRTNLFERLREGRSKQSTRHRDLISVLPIVVGHAETRSDHQTSNNSDT